jgi:hypothetical protein
MSNDSGFSVIYDKIDGVLVSEMSRLELDHKL